MIHYEMPGSGLEPGSTQRDIVEDTHVYKASFRRHHLSTLKESAFEPVRKGKLGSEQPPG